MIPDTKLTNPERIPALAPHPLVSGFTHDLRSPLFALLGYLQLLQKLLEHTDSEKVRDYLRLARESGLRLDQMVTEMLDLLRFGQEPAAMKREAVSVAALFQKLWNTFSVIALEKKVNLRMIVKGEEGMNVCADSRYLERALENLLSNAIKFSPPEADVILVANRTSGRLCFEVIDVGRGIPLEAQTRIFEPFTQIQDSDRASGFGLGLAIVRFIARAHEGDVGLVSQPGSGSRFVLWIPSA